jgi:hypothetical protein
MDDVQSLVKSSKSDEVVRSHWYYGICPATMEEWGRFTSLVTFVLSTVAMAMSRTAMLILIQALNKYATLT